MAVGGGVVEAEGVGDDRCRGLEDKLVQCRQATGNGGDAEVSDEWPDRACGQWLAGAAAGERTARCTLPPQAECGGRPTTCSNRSAHRRAVEIADLRGTRRDMDAIAPVP